MSMSKDSLLRSRMRPWTQVPVSRRRRDRVNISVPPVDTYKQQMDQVQRRSEQLRRSEAEGSYPFFVELPSLIRPFMRRSHTFTSAPGPPQSSAAKTYSPELQWTTANAKHANAKFNSLERRGSPTEDIWTLDHEDNQVFAASQHPFRPLANSYPVTSGQCVDKARPARRQRKTGWTDSSVHASTELLCPRTVDMEEAERFPKKGKEKEGSSSGVSSKGSSEQEEGTTPREVFRSSERLLSEDLDHQDGVGGSRELLDDGHVDILQLCQHMRTHGLGEPVMSTHSHSQGLSTRSLPPGVRARCLPRDPSTREKIKGRARLDYEMANLRALAFCEQQQQRVFRTASADLRNRDVRLLEEEERENLHRDLHTGRGRREAGANDDGEEEDDDDASSLVGSPLTREELFLRIEAWAEDVDLALNRGRVAVQRRESTIA